jgi:hypothetical protein
LARAREQPDLPLEVEAAERLLDATLDGRVDQKRPRPKKPRMSRTTITMIRIVMIETASGGATMERPPGT